jgi:hypothetical protein
VRAPGVEFRQGDIVTGPVDPGGFDVARPRDSVREQAATAVVEPTARRAALFDLGQNAFHFFRAESTHGLALDVAQ